MFIEQRAGKRRLSALLAQDVILRRGEQLAPFSIAMGNGELRLRRLADGGGMGRDEGRGR